MAAVDKYGKELKVGDLVEFIDPTCVGNAWPEFGKVYTISEIYCTYDPVLLKFKEIPRGCYDFNKTVS